VRLAFGRACQFSGGCDLTKNSPHRLDVGARFHERLADGVDAVSQGKLETFAVMIRKGRDAKINAREIKTLTRAKFTADSNLATHLLTVDRIDQKLNQLWLVPPYSRPPVRLGCNYVRVLLR
jgi:hypothetical protein